MRDYSKCPWCGHAMTREVHDPDDGCLADWEWDEHGIATKHGCDCSLTLARHG